MLALDRETGEHRQPDYLKINPMGKVPALRHGDVVVTEASAICQRASIDLKSPKKKPPGGRRDSRTAGFGLVSY